MTPHDKLLVAAKRAMEAGDHPAALSAANELILHDEGCAIAYFIAGLCHLQSDQPGVARPLFQKCVALEPDRPQAWNNLGCTYQERQPDLALPAFKKAHGLDPTSTDVLSNLVSSSSALGLHEDAVEWADVCLTYAPDHPDATYNAAFALLHLGRWEEAWKRYAPSMGVNEMRRARNYHADRETPRFNLDEFEPGDVCVVYGEQGVGDQIIFASMLNDFMDLGVEVIIETNKQMEDLFRRSFPNADVFGTLGEDFCAWPAEVRIDWKLEMGALGEFVAPQPFRTGRYLDASPTWKAAWRAALKAADPAAKLRVGIAWSAGTLGTCRHERTVPFEELKPLMGIEGVQLVCLEYTDAREALGGAPIYNPRLDLVNRNYDITAALVDELDLVIAPTTAVVDCAGALGKEVWVMCPTRPPWRYADYLGEDAMFVYESARVFRQSEDHEWGDVVNEIAGRLKRRAGMLS